MFETITPIDNSVLVKREYATEEDIEKICYKNIWRVWSAVEAVAQK